MVRPVPRVARLPLLVLSLILLLPDTTFSWNDTGHRLVALVAYEQLDPATRSRVVALIRRHPRFSADFNAKMPLAVRNGSQADKDRWLFTQAAVWPDIARDQPTFHRALWHFVNQPIFLTPADEKAFADALPVNVGTALTDDDDDPNWNVIQAVKNAQRALAAQGSQPSKAVSLAWLFHLVGDIHQPLHSSAVFSRRQFAKGDRGGGLVPTAINDNLHGFWDAAAGSTGSPRTLTRRVQRWLKDPEFEALGKEALKSLDVEVWTDESAELAKGFVYSQDILQILNNFESGKFKTIHPIQLDEDYAEMAADIARDRVVEAGYRLAAILEQLF